MKYYWYITINDHLPFYRRMENRQVQFIDCGFTITLSRIDAMADIIVTHHKKSAITAFMLKYDCSTLHIVQHQH